MSDQIDEIRRQLESIAEQLTDASMTVLREAVESGAQERPAIDKKLSQARRAVEKAARLLEGAEPSRH